MNKKIIFLLLFLLFIAALCLRIIPAWENVFGSGIVKFSSVDAYYHMRLVDNLLQNFPHRLSFDIYTSFPGGSIVSWAPLFDWLLAAIIWIIGLGHPSQGLVDSIGAVFPAVLGALVVFPVYFIGKKVFNKGVGLLSAALIAIIPGEFLGRTVLGFTDHHALETLLVAMIALFVILCNNRSIFDWRTIVCGLLVGAYMLAWVGASLAIFILLLFVFIKSVGFRESVKNYSLVFLIALIISMLLLPKQTVAPLLFVTLGGAVIVPWVLDFAGWRLKGVRYPIAALLFVAISIITLRFAIPSLFSNIMAQLGYIFAWQRGTSIMEMQPILFPGFDGKLSFAVVWGNFTTGIILSIVSLSILVYLTIKRKSSNMLFIVIWSFVMLFATLGQRRFAYYFAVNVAILTGYISWITFEYFGIKRMKYVVKKRAHKIMQFVGTSITAISIFFVVFFPNIGLAIDTAKSAAYVPSNGWCESLEWMKNNTPEPFGNSEFYYANVSKDFSYPDTAYGIMAWWDYGHWITRIARRLPNNSPASCGSCPTFFSATDAEKIYKLSEELKIGYVIIDYSLPISKFYAVVLLSSSSITPVDPDDYYSVYYVEENGQYAPKMLYHEDYYRSTVVRMYNFDCQKVVPSEVFVIFYEERTSVGGNPYKLIVNALKFGNYQEAVDFISSIDYENCRIVGIDPFVSPVPLEALDRYELVYASRYTINGIPEVKIFQFVGVNSDEKK